MWPPFATSARGLAVVFAPDVSGPERSQCESVTIADAGATSLVVCVLPATLCRSCAFGIFNGATGVLVAPGADRFGAPGPVIFAGSLHRFLPETRPSNELFAASNVVSDAVSFFGANFAAGRDVSQLTVRFGPASEPLLFGCDLSASATNESVVSCFTNVTDQPYKLRQLMHFSVIVNGMRQTSTDVYRFAAQPEIRAVWGCPVTRRPTLAREDHHAGKDGAATGTEGCTATGGTWISICGHDFSFYSLAFVAGAACADARPMDTAALPPECTSGLVCQLPAGTGVDQPVSVSSGALVSDPVSGVSYAVPTIVGLKGCIQGPQGLANCSRRGGDLMEVHGFDFGVNPPVVFVVRPFSALVRSQHLLALRSGRALLCVSAVSTATLAWTASCRQAKEPSGRSCSSSATASRRVRT